MTNEELVAAIQGGDDSLMLTLWEQVERLVRWHANRWASAGSEWAGVTAEDLYQSGYLGLVDAVKTYDPERGLQFAGWLGYYLKKEFITALGRRTSRQRGEPLNYAISLDAPLKFDSDDTERTVADAIADPCDPYDETTQKIYHAQLREALNHELDTLTPELRETVKRRYYLGQTLDTVADYMRTYKATAQQREKSALRQLRRSARLAKFIDERTNYFLHVSVGRFHSTHTSAVESLVLERERMREQDARAPRPLIATQNNWEVKPYELDL